MERVTGVDGSNHRSGQFTVVKEVRVVRFTLRVQEGEGRGRGAGSRKGRSRGSDVL